MSPNYMFLKYFSYNFWMKKMMVLFIFHKNFEKDHEITNYVCIVMSCMSTYPFSKKALINNPIDWRTLMCDVMATLCFIQTEAECRRREAGVIQSMENRPESCMYLCMYVFADYERGRRPREFKVVPYDSRRNSTLLRHKIIWMRCLKNAWHMILAPIGLTQAVILMYLLFT